MLSALIKMFSFFECSGMPSRIRTGAWSGVQNEFATALERSTGRG